MYFPPPDIQVITEIKENRAGRDITRLVSSSSFLKAKIYCSKKTEPENWPSLYHAGGFHSFKCHGDKELELIESTFQTK